MSASSKRIPVRDLTVCNACLCTITGCTCNFPDCLGFSTEGEICCIKSGQMCCKKLDSQENSEAKCCLCTEGGCFLKTPKTCCQQSNQCCCIDTRCALPCTKEVPMMCTCLPCCLLYPSFGCCSKVGDKVEWTQKEIYSCSIVNPNVAARKYSSILDDNPAYDSRLDGPIGWMAAMNTVGQFTTLDLGAPEVVNGIVIQGRRETQQYITRLKISTSNDGEEFDEVGEFDGQASWVTGAEKVRINFDSTCARYVKVEVLACCEHMSLRCGAIVEAEATGNRERVNTVVVYYNKYIDGIEFKYDDGSEEVFGDRGGDDPEVAIWNVPDGEYITKFTTRNALNQGCHEGCSFGTGSGKESPWFGKFPKEKLNYFEATPGFQINGLTSEYNGAWDGWAGPLPNGVREVDNGDTFYYIANKDDLTDVPIDHVRICTGCCCTTCGLLFETPYCLGVKQEGVCCCIQCEQSMCKYITEDNEDNLCCVCCDGGSYCVSPSTCVQFTETCFCIDTRCAIPCTEKVPCFLTCLPGCVIAADWKFKLGCCAKAEDLRYQE